MSNKPNQLWNVEFIKEKETLSRVCRRGSSVEIHNSATFSKKRFNLQNSPDPVRTLCSTMQSVNENDVSIEYSAFPDYK